MSKSRTSRIRGLYKLSVDERIRELARLGWLPERAAEKLQRRRQILTPLAADKMVENVIGVFGLPLAIAPNFIVNSREILVPLVVEEPSIVAALSSAASLARATGGFHASCDESLLVGQIHVTEVADVDVALTALKAAQQSLLELASQVHPRLIARGGGVRNCEFRTLSLPGGGASIVVHLLVDTCDAMGANIVNTVCEAVAPKVEEICGGHVVLRILSNLADRSVFHANVKFATDDLGTDSMSGAAVRDRIVQANDIAIADPYRAATHNKGIMNGIDALAIATGNDWRAIEAGAHAFAASGGAYAALTHWSRAHDGALYGEIRIPLKVGVVGGTVQSNPAAALGLSIVATQSATELAEVMAAVGLAQNFSALRALATQGIQHGHMRLHARSVVAGTGVPGEHIADIVDELVAGGDINRSKALALAAHLDQEEPALGESAASAAGKIILFGEHAAVYGRHALALPIQNAVRAVAIETEEPTRLRIAAWQLDTTIDLSRSDGVDGAVNCLLAELDLVGRHFSIQATSVLPRGMGLGSSAAFAVAVSRAIMTCCDIELDDKRVNAIAFECEKLAHGTPSGVDNTIACYGRPVLFQRGHASDRETTGSDQLLIEPLVLAAPVPLVVAFSHERGATRNMVEGVRSRFDKEPAMYSAVFDQIDALSLRGAAALKSQDYDQLGEMMNVCQGLLNALQVSTPDLEQLIAIARRGGAVGAKLTGAGGGGAIVALCPGKVAALHSAFTDEGYATLRWPESNRDAK